MREVARGARICETGLFSGQFNTWVGTVADGLCFRSVWPDHKSVYYTFYPVKHVNCWNNMLSMDPWGINYSEDKLLLVFTSVLPHVSQFW